MLKVLLFPGQGAQYKGMGADLWGKFPELEDAASRILGYSIVDLCLKDPYNQLRLTQFTQPALYVVGALAYYDWRERGEIPSALAGHSLGEYPALLAAGCFDFETGLRLVQKRGQLMSQASGGAMAAVLGMRADALQSLLHEHGIDNIDLANLNSPTQTVIAGEVAAVNAVEKLLLARNIRCVMLAVSAAFHSRHMRDAQQEFAQFLSRFTLDDPRLPVISNVTARPYRPGEIAQLLAQQIASPVLWTDSIRYLMGQGDFTYHEMGANSRRIGGNVLARLVDEIRRTETPIYAEAPPAIADLSSPPAPAACADHAESEATGAGQVLGSRVFRDRYGLRYAYVAGGMHHGVSSTELVVRLARAGMLGYFGADGLSRTAIEAAIQTLRTQLTSNEAFGLNLVADHDNPSEEDAIVELCLKYGVCCLEAAGFTRITRALALFRISGLSRDTSGNIHCAHRILAKVSQLEVAGAFLRPAPVHWIDQLLREGAITEAQAVMASHVPMSHDICVEAEPGGFPDGGIPIVLLPAMQQLRHELSERYKYHEPVCMGLAGGMGTPASAAAAFAMGADFVLTGSINQCTIESGATDTVKSMLQQAGIHDMAYAPATSMFEFGARIQVLKKGLLFPMRANQLHGLYTHHNRLENIPERTRIQLERALFKRPLNDVRSDVLQQLQAQGRMKAFALAQSSPRFLMAQVFKWYLDHSKALARSGSSEDLVNYQVRTGPALGAFNQWVRGTVLENWAHRHVDVIAMTLLDATAEHLRSACERIFGAVSK